MINNKLCPVCIKRGRTCMWEDKLYKLNGTKKNPIEFDITVDKCSSFLLDENVEVEDLTGNNESEDDEE